MAEGSDGDPASLPGIQHFQAPWNHGDIDPQHERLVVLLVTSGLESTAMDYMQEAYPWLDHACVVILQGPNLKVRLSHQNQCGLSCSWPVVQASWGVKAGAPLGEASVVSSILGLGVQACER